MRAYADKTRGGKFSKMKKLYQFTKICNENTKSYDVCARTSARACVHVLKVVVEGGGRTQSPLQCCTRSHRNCSLRSRWAALRALQVILSGVVPSVDAAAADVSTSRSRSKNANCATRPTLGKYGTAAKLEELDSELGTFSTASGGEALSKTAFRAR